MSTMSDVLSGIKKMLVIEDKVGRMERDMDSLSEDVRDLRKGLGGVSDRVSDLEGYMRAATQTPFGEKPKLEGK
jgi:hypothetical protein